MPWKLLEDMSKEEQGDFDREYKKKARFLVDESLDPDTVRVLQHFGYGANTIADVRLSGHDDEDVAARALREGRIVLTSDKDFLDERRFPTQKGPAIIVLPTGEIDSDRFATAIRNFCTSSLNTARCGREQKSI